MQDIYAIPTLLLLAVVTSIFYAVYRRQRNVTSLLMFLAWVGFTLRLFFEVVQMMPLHLSDATSTVVDAVSDCCLLSAVVLLNSSLSPKRLGRSWWTLYGVIGLLPLNAFVLTADLTSGSRWPGMVEAALFLVLVGITGAWYLTMSGKSRIAGLGLRVVVASLGLFYIARHNVDAAIDLILAGELVFAAIAFGRNAARRTMGSYLVVTGLVGWSCIFLATLVVTPSPEIYASLTRNSDLLKILTAIGLVLHLLEEETNSTTAAQRRERRLRQELQGYAAIDLALLPGISQQLVFDHVCASISRNSPFARCAILMRSSSGTEVVASRDIDPAALERLRHAAARLDSGSVAPPTAAGKLQSFPAGPQEADAGYLLQFPSSSLVPQGGFWLSGLKGARGLPPQESLLPLESLAGRLSVALENRDLVQRLIRADRLAGLGKLAGGIAHELNNPLTVVRGYAELIEDATAEPRTRQQVGAILKESERMKRIVADLSQFWRTAGPDYALVHCGDLLSSIEKLHRHELQKQGIALTVHVPAELPPVMGSYDSLSQVMLQLIKNAVQAMTQPPDGADAARNTAALAREGSIRMEAELSGDRVQIRITDNGPGFADPERAFDPFYTTMEPGEGTGLGLSVCYGLIRQHRGDISARNLQTGGAAVLVDLPAANRFPGDSHGASAGKHEPSAASCNF